LPALGRLVAISAVRIGAFCRILSPQRLAAVFVALRQRPSRSAPIPTSPGFEIDTTELDQDYSVDARPEQPVALESPGPPVPDADDDTTESRPAVRPIPLELEPAIKGELPPYSLLEEVVPAEFAEADNQKRAKLIEEALASYGVDAQVTQINPGPSVTQFGVEPGWDRKYKRVVERDQQGKPKLDKDGAQVERQDEVSKTRVKVERITSLSQNLALALAVPSVRIEAPVPGQPLVGIEVPNSNSVSVGLKGVIESTAFQRMKAKSKLALALGIGAAGEPVSADLTKMPHLLIAGTTGSGKSVCLNSIVTCLLMHNHPRDVRLMIIDPKQVEFVQFAAVPHLISPLVTKLDKAVDALRRAIREMDSRFEKFAAVGVRNIEKYNQSRMAVEPMPYLLIVVDELNQLMWFSSEVVEASICRLAQLGRATGIHLILATQRPSTDVITGVIKANFPARIAFKLPAYVDSRTILDTGGAEKLLGRGDMIYLPSDTSKARRLRGCYLTDHEIDRVTRFWYQPHAPAPGEADDEVAKAFASLPADEGGEEDTLLPEARRLARDTSHISTSLIQRRLHVGYPRAARIMDALEKEGTVVRSEPTSPAEVIDREEEDE
jgi:S-DNA-T family DNA segregation ATPase FtsK/SpoIIIE